MPQPIRILFLLEDLCYGGTQRQILELARRLDRQIFSPVILTLTGPTDLDELARRADIELHHMGSGPAVAPAFFLRLGSVLRKLAPQILVPCTALPNIWGRIWGRLAFWRSTSGPRIVGTCRGGGAPRRQHERILWRLADHMICNSQELHKILLDMGLPGSHVSYVPNGVDTQFFTPAAPLPSQRKALILCVARLAADKDHVTLLQAFDMLRRQYPEAHLKLVGDGPEEARLRRWAGEHMPSASVEFVPGSDDMREHYRTARIFALSSVREGQPNVLLEAMACGLPVCATAVGGVPRLVEDGISGYLSPAGDAAALAANCCRLLHSESACNTLGQAGRQRVEADFSFTAMVGAHERIFATLCSP
jgi:glycosyltransferase involved in cell wall biosynthesis